MKGAQDGDSKAGGEGQEFGGGCKGEANLFECVHEFFGDGGISHRDDCNCCNHCSHFIFNEVKRAGYNKRRKWSFLLRVEKEEVIMWFTVGILAAVIIMFAIIFFMGRAVKKL